MRESDCETRRWVQVHHAGLCGPSKSPSAAVPYDNRPVGGNRLDFAIEAEVLHSRLRRPTKHTSTEGAGNTHHDFAVGGNRPHETARLVRQYTEVLHSGRRCPAKGVILA